MCCGREGRGLVAIAMGRCVSVALRADLNVDPAWVREMVVDDKRLVSDRDVEEGAPRGPASQPTTHLARAGR